MNDEQPKENNKGRTVHLAWELNSEFLNPKAHRARGTPHPPPNIRGEIRETVEDVRFYYTLSLPNYNTGRLREKGSKCFTS